MKVRISVTVIVLILNLISTVGCLNVHDTGARTSEKGKSADNQKAISTVNLGEKDEESIRKLLQDFTDAAKEKNIDDISQYFDLKEYIEGYNLEIMKKDFGETAKKPTYEERLLNMEKKYNLFLLGFTLTEADMVENELDDVNKRLQQLNLNELSIQRIDTPYEEQTKSAFNNMIEKRCTRYGAESIAYRTILYNCGKNTYYCGFELFKYNGTWKINELKASVTSVDSNIVTIPCSEKEYLEIIEMK